MIRSMARSTKVAALVMVIGLGMATSAMAQDKNSGFLKDYSQLQPVKDSVGNERLIWVSPKFTRANYQHVLLDPVDFYPAPQPSETVPESTLVELRTYIERAMRRAVSSVTTPSTAPGPGVARIRVAITAVGTEGGLKAYQLIPVALVFTAAKTAAGESKRDVKLFVEAEINDSVTGGPLALIVREAEGIQIKNKEVLTLTPAKPQIDKWAQAVREFLAARLK